MYLYYYMYILAKGCYNQLCKLITSTVMFRKIINYMTIPGSRVGPHKNLNNFGQKQFKVWAWNLYHSTALFEAAKSLAPSNIIGHG